MADSRGSFRKLNLLFNTAIDLYTGSCHSLEVMDLTKYIKKKKEKTYFTLFFAFLCAQNMGVFGRSKYIEETKAINKWVAEEV